jgi:hypothetical protein
MSDLPYPPSDLPSFLRCCAGEWMSLRSRFDLSSASGDDDWHSSERGDLVVEALPGQSDDHLGSLVAGPKGADHPRSLHFHSDGRFSSETEEGRWILWPDGSLELVIDQGEAELRERIWFTKVNLRLRSTVRQHRDGSPGSASFCSEIRRVSRPSEG